MKRVYSYKLNNVLIIKLLHAKFMLNLKTRCSYGRNFK